MDFSNSVIMPREDFIELSTVAFDNNNPVPIKERLATTAQTTATCAIIGSAFVLGTWGYVKAHDWLEEKRFKRATATRIHNVTNQ